VAALIPVKSWRVLLSVDGIYFLTKRPSLYPGIVLPSYLIKWPML